LVAVSDLYVIFRVAESEYALPAMQVLQLESYSGVTAVPGTAPHVTGIVQVRGRIVPVIDLRLLFGHPAIEPALDCRIIVVEVGARTVGLCVDMSREVLRLATDQFQPTPALMAEQSRGFVRGVARIGARLLMLFDLAKILGEEALYDDPVPHLTGAPVGQRALPG
jgi:purine-binding chemotaxis protein CheW